MSNSTDFGYVRTLEGWKGEARVYVNDQDRYVVVSRAHTFDRGDETMIFAWNEVTQRANFMDLYAGYGETHEEALNNWTP